MGVHLAVVAVHVSNGAAAHVALYSSLAVPVRAHAAARVLGFVGHGDVVTELGRAAEEPAAHGARGVPGPGVPCSRVRAQRGPVPAHPAAQLARVHHVKAPRRAGLQVVGPVIETHGQPGEPPAAAGRHALQPVLVPVVGAHVLPQLDRVGEVRGAQFAPLPFDRHRSRPIIARDGHRSFGLQLAKVHAVHFGLHEIDLKRKRPVSGHKRHNGNMCRRLHGLGSFLSDETCVRFKV